ncbi:MAG: carboxypeptidase M32 [Syntrophobacteraceae bacterium]
MKPKEAYKWLVDYSRETALYDSMRGLLGWDQRTCLPAGGQTHRAQQLATLAGLLNRRTTNPKIGEMLSVVEGSDLLGDPLSDVSVNIRELRRAYDRTVKIPESLAIQIARASSEGELAWQKARPENDWRGFLPYLERIISLKREEAANLDSRNEIYDGLIEGFEPGESAGSIEPIFDKLSIALMDLLQRIRNSPEKPDISVLQGEFPELAQRNLINEMVERLGYDLHGGRIDRSAHPFSSTIGPGDVRITTRFDPDSFGMALFSSIHETGHALYEQGLPAKHWGAPRGRAVSMAIHESQSLMWENMVARSQGFWNHFYPLVKKHLPQLQRVDIAKFVFAVNDVRPSLIRTEADEVTYNLHIILRFELERALIGRELEAEDLPEAWNDKMKHYLGIVPPDYFSGVMQDIHWSEGAIGYFPSYALGNIYAAQFYAKAEDTLGNLEELFEAGEFVPFVKWFRERIHSQGSRYLPRDLVMAVTGKPLSADYLISYLEEKYNRLYRL